MSNLGLKLKEARIKKKITQEELANRIGISKYAIAKYEQGQREPKLKILTSIIDELEIDFWDIAQGSDLEVEVVEPYECNDDNVKEVYNKMNLIKLLDSWKGDLRSDRRWSSLAGYDKAYIINSKLDDIEYNEYRRREIENYEYIYMNLKKFRNDFYEEVIEAIDFIIEFKLNEAEKRIKKY